MPRSSSVHAFVLATLLAAGVQAVLLVVMVIASKPLDRLFESANPGHLRVHANGEVVLQQPFGEYRSLAGRSLDDADSRRWLNGPDEHWLTPTWLPGPLTERGRQTRLSWWTRICELPGDPRVAWFLVHTSRIEGQAYFIGYDDATKQPVGYIGSDGFRNSPPDRSEWFAMDAAPRERLVANASSSRTAAGVTVIASKSALPRGVVFLAADDRVWEIDLKARTARVLFDSAATVSMAAATTTDGQAELLVRTRSEVIAVDFQGRRRTSWQLPSELSATGFQWYALAEGTALAQTLRQSHNVLSVDLTWIGRGGKVTKTESLEAQLGLPAGGPTWFFMIAAMTPSPLTMTTVSAIGLPSSEVSRGEASDLPTAVVRTLAEAWPALLLVYLMSASLAWLAYRRQVRYALPGAGAWSAFVALFGVPGWLAYRWHRRWPVLEACGECRRPAPRDRENCASCGHVFAPPALLGTEVFA